MFETLWTGVDIFKERLKPLNLITLSPPNGDVNTSSFVPLKYQGYSEHYSYKLEVDNPVDT